MLTRVLFITLAFFTFSPLVHADKIDALLFEDANIALKQADELNARELSPKSYAKADSLYKEAKSRLQKGHSINKIKKALAGATEHYKKSITSAKIATSSFGSLIQAREDAIRAEAKKYTQQEWLTAEKAFIEATTKLEVSTLKKAQKTAERAESLFRQAELTAIKANYLTETRNLLAQAKKERTHKLAPKTYAKAELLLAKAEKILTENRYDIDEPRAIAREAKYEAGHALKIARQVKSLNSKDISAEGLILSLEELVVRIGSLLDLTPEFDFATNDPTATIHRKIQNLLDDSTDLEEKVNEMVGLEKDLATLEERLGVQSQRIQQQELQRKRISRLETLFSPNEAIILKKGNNVILRMVGLNFKTSSASLTSENYYLLKKVQKAIKVFPNAGVIVEGHTDSFGSDASNQELSKRRAESVRTYLIANGTANTVSSIGYGETKPIGNNETAEGRRKNRRIDLVIRP